MSARFKHYAVVKEGTDEVVGQLLEDLKIGQYVKKNGYQLTTIVDGEIEGKEAVFLSTAQKHITQIQNPHDPHPVHATPGSLGLHIFIN